MAGKACYVIGSTTVVVYLRDQAACGRPLARAIVRAAAELRGAVGRPERLR